MSQAEIIESGFSSINIGSWMWAFDITKDNTAGLPTFWGQIDYFTYSYCSAGDYKMIDKNLYNEIPASDTRKQWFHPSVLISWYKFYDSGRKAMGDRTWTNDIVYMRVEEMYLINAEANTRANHLTEARASLKALLDQRDEETASKVNDMNADQLLENIYYNWRVEMWAEGRGLLTLKRFHKSMVRGENNYALTGETISFEDSRLIFEIPEREITNNPNLQK
ncbi:RagB/SusD family nutrient uptake outer membrane protein [Bacteroides stercorirosoris]|nr:RagB/SusD family nutrient uptake outer membrane protein [Bacteroides stercorirosoris]